MQSKGYNLLRIARMAPNIRSTLSGRPLTVLPELPHFLQARHLHQTPPDLAKTPKPREIRLKNPELVKRFYELARVAGEEKRAEDYLKQFPSPIKTHDHENHQDYLVLCLSLEDDIGAPAVIALIKKALPKKLGGNPPTVRSAPLTPEEKENIKVYVNRLYQVIIEGYIEKQANLSKIEFSPLLHTTIKERFAASLIEHYSSITKLIETAKYYRTHDIDLTATAENLRRELEKEPQIDEKHWQEWQTITASSKFSIDLDGTKHPVICLGHIDEVSRVALDILHCYRKNTEVNAGAIYLCHMGRRQLFEVPNSHMIITLDIIPCKESPGIEAKIREIAVSEYADPGKAAERQQIADTLIHNINSGKTELNPNFKWHPPYSTPGQLSSEYAHLIKAKEFGLLPPEWMTFPTSDLPSSTKIEFNWEDVENGKFRTDQFVHAWVQRAGLSYHDIFAQCPKKTDLIHSPDTEPNTELTTAELIQNNARKALNKGY